MTAVPIDHSHRRARQPEPAYRRTGSKVRRHSQAAGREKWQHFGKRQGRRLLLALEIHQEKQRRHGERTGARRGRDDVGGISHGAIKLARLLVAIAVKYQGRLEPSVEWMAEKLNVPAKTVHAWKAQLKRHGFLDWRRRWVETGKEGLRGPQVEQTSNAYWLKTPTAAWDAAQKILDQGKPEPSEDDRMRGVPAELRDAIEKQNEAMARRAERQSGIAPGRRIDGT
jgi:hypothetical protein